MSSKIEGTRLDEQMKDAGKEIEHMVDTVHEKAHDRLDEIEGIRRSLEKEIDDGLHLIGHEFLEELSYWLGRTKERIDGEIEGRTEKGSEAK